LTYFQPKFFRVMSGMVSSWLSCSSCPVHACMFWPPSSLLFLFCLLWLSCLGCLILAFFFSSFVPTLSYLSCHVLIVLSYLLCPVCSALIFLPCSVCPAFFLHGRKKRVIIVRYHCGGRPEEVNSCVLNSYMVYL
jgi:hypothetical protein